MPDRSRMGLVRGPKRSIVVGSDQVCNPCLSAVRAGRRSRRSPQRRIVTAAGQSAQNRRRNPPAMCIPPASTISVSLFADESPIVALLYRASHPTPTLLVK